MKNKSYKKDIEGFSNFIKDLQLNVEVITKFKENECKVITQKPKITNKWEIKNSLLSFKPIINTFFDDSKCLVKIFVPDTTMYIKCKTAVYMNIDEFFVDYEVDVSDIDNMTLDFKEGVDLLISNLTKEIHNRLLTLNNGSYNEEYKYKLIAPYESCKLKYTFSEFN